MSEGRIKSFQKLARSVGFRTKTRPRHIPDASRPGYTYCGRERWAKNGRTLLRTIDLRTDSIESAECKACQRSDTRRMLQEHKTREQISAAVKPEEFICDCMDCSIAGEPTH